MKDIHIRFRSEEIDHLSRVTEKSGLSISEYVRLLVRADIKDDRGIESEALGKLWVYKLTPAKRKRMVEKSLKKKGELEPYMEGILDRKPQANIYQICTAITNRFKTEINRNTIKMIRRVKERFKKRRQRLKKKTMTWE